MLQAERMPTEAVHVEQNCLLIEASGRRALFDLPGTFGIRLENLLLVQPAEPTSGAKPFLGFETLTLAPFDRR